MYYPCSTFLHSFDHCSKNIPSISSNNIQEIPSWICNPRWFDCDGHVVVIHTFFTWIFWKNSRKYVVAVESMWIIHTLKKNVQYCLEILKGAIYKIAKNENIIDTWITNITGHKSKNTIKTSQTQNSCNIYTNRALKELY